MSNKRKFFNRKDIIIILIPLLLALCGFFAYTLTREGGGGLYAELYVDGAMVEKVYLNEDRVFSLDGLPNVEFEVKDHAIAFIHSDCKDRLCMLMGWQGSVGGFAACLPNNVMLWVDSDDGKKIDAVTK